MSAVSSTGGLLLRSWPPRAVGVRLAAVVPPQCHRIVLDLSVVVEKMRMFEGNVRFALGKVEANFGTDGIRFLVHLAERRRFNLPSGTRDLKARNGMLTVWHAMSPSAPQPKSCQPRQLNGS